MSRFPIKAWRCLLLVTILGASTVAFGGAFQVWEESAAGTGDYHAGGAAEADDASTEFYNPAGMTRLKKPQLSFGVAYIPLDVAFNGTVGGTATNGYVNGGTNNWVPNFHIVYPVNEIIALGFGVTAPFGLKTDYPDDDSIPTSAAATLTKLYTINYNPNIAFQISQAFSLGVGFDALYGTADYDQAYFIPNTNLNNELSAWGYGWNMGALYQFTPATRVGVSYRSRIVFNGTGTSTQTTSPPVTNNNLTATLNLPATTIFSLYSDVTDKWAVLSSIYYTQWNVFQSVNLDNLAGSDQPVDDAMNYKNSWNLVLGTHYKVTKAWMLKWAIAWDQTPTQLGYRDIRLPDADRYVLAAGVHWQVSERTGWDFGYAHLFTGTVNVDNTQSGAPVTETGVATNNTNVFGTQFTINL